MESGVSSTTKPKRECEMEMYLKKKKAQIIRIQNQELFLNRDCVLTADEAFISIQMFSEWISDYFFFTYL